MTARTAIRWSRRSSVVGDLDLAEIGLERLLARRDRPSRRNRCRSGHAARFVHRPAPGWCCARPLGADHAGVGHRLHHQPAALLRGGEMLGRRKARRRLDQPGQHRRLGQRQLLRLAVEIMAGGGAKPIDPVAEIDARHVAREDLVLGQPAFEPEGDDHFLRLALQRPVAGQEAGLGELLGDRAAALANPAAAHIGDHRAADPARIDAPVAVEAAVLDRDEGRRGRAGRAWRHRPAPP